MAENKKIIIINGSPKKDGNTALLVDWCCEGAHSQGAAPEVINAAFLTYKTVGCISCRKCQQSKKYECVIKDDATAVLRTMAAADVIVMASPLYFFSASAQIKIIFDRMFSLYKWDNAANTFTSPLKGKTFALIASAYEDVGLDALEKPFALTADYTGMKFESLLIANAGVSGEIKEKAGAREKAFAFGKRLVAH